MKNVFNRGFSLAEMMVVMLMLSIIFAAAAPILTKRAASTSEAGGDSIPKGLVSIWSGKVSEIPSGWHLCDGTNGTPDLRSRFVYGAGGDTNTKTEVVSGQNTEPKGHWNAGFTGGEEAHILTINEMPAHTHSGSSSSAGAHTHTRGTMNITGYVVIPVRNFLPASSGCFYTEGGGQYWAPHTDWDGTRAMFNAARSWTGETSSSGDHSHAMSLDNTGGSAAHLIMPRFYTLAYIMKT